MRKTFLLIALIAMLHTKSWGQACTSLGQTPASAFPVCGSASFVQNNVPLCNGTPLPAPPCGPTNILADRNCFWYKFTCFATGTLGLTITPNNLADDYDWQVFDVTGRNPNDVYTDASMFVCCNWSGAVGITGTSASATNPNSCSGNTPIFSGMPTLQVGRDYLLMISHFTPTQSGYSLLFNNGTAVITDPNLPSITGAKASCDGKKIFVKLSKEMKCSSLANGSEFSINNASSVVPGAVGVGCNNSFDMDSIVITLNNALPAGNHILNLHGGSDMNTLLDNCDNAIPGSNIPFTVASSVPVLMDSISPVPCSATQLQLVFKKPILCSSIAANGSDFIIVGPAPVTTTGAVGNCSSDGLTSIITINLAAPISTAGNYQIKLLVGTDGNTLVNECGLQTPLNSTLNFIGLSAANASFTYQLKYGCKADTIHFNYSPSNGETQWKWSFDDNTTSNLLNISKTYNSFGQKNVKLWAANPSCSDSTTQTIMLNNVSLKAGFAVIDHLCPNEMATFTDSSKGNIDTWNWDFNNGFTSSSPTPPVQNYMPVTKETILATRLIITDTFHCIDTVYRNIKLIHNCNIAVPTAFTPNGDGKNDYLYPLFAYKADKLLFRVYNRYGQLVFSTQDWTNKWDGKLKGVPQDDGVYVWMLQYTHHDTGQQVFQKGTTVLMR